MQFFTDTPPSLSTWESLTHVLASRTAAFVMPAINQYEAMGQLERHRFNAARKAFVAGGMTVQTPQVAELIRATETVMSQNLSAMTGRRGILVSGPSAVGKTTACLALMRYVYSAFQHQCAAQLAAGAVPVAYVEVPPSSTPKGMMQRFADFYALPYQQRTSLNELKKAVVHTMRQSMTQVVVVDELHNLARRSSSNGESVDTLKDLSNDAPATFVYAGIKLEESGLLAGPRGEQVARRFSPLRMALYDYTTPTERKAWRGVVMAFSKALPLFAHEPKDLLADAQWLHERSGGNIGTLQSILVQSTHRLVDADDPHAETLTVELMAEARRDIRAEAAEQLAARAHAAGIARGKSKRKKSSAA